MLTIDEALARVLAHVPPNTIERLALQAAAGRVLAEDVYAPEELPPWTASAMDGFAVRAADVPGELRVIETVPAGGYPKWVVAAGQATRIMTGAPVPEGADAVVMVEDTESLEDRVRIHVSAAPGQHLRPRGSEVARGARVLEAGQVVHAGVVGLCAALGVPSLRVWARPRVAILSTGDEVVEPGFPLGPGQIHSSNGHALAMLVREAGGDPVDLGNAPDDPGAIASALRSALRCDVVLTTGGVSVGDYDHVKGVLAELGIPMDFWRVAMKPGKPLAFGVAGGRPVFGLPGNPVSCMVNFYQFVRPVLRRMVGDPRPFLPVLDVELTGVFRRKPGRPELLRVRLWREGEQIRGTVAGHQGSAGVQAMADAHGFALIAGDRTEVSGRVAVQVFDTSFLFGTAAAYRW